MKSGFKKCAVWAFIFATMILGGCTMVNVPNEDLRKAMPPDPAKEIEDASIKFITANYKLYACISELDTAFRLGGGGADPGTVGEILAYAKDFVAETETALDEVSDWGRKNGGKLDELIQKGKDLKKKEQGALIHFRALMDNDFGTAQADYIESIRAYLKVAGEIHGFLEERYPDLVLGVGDAQEKYNGGLVRLIKAREAINVRLNEVSSLFRVLLKSKAELMGLTPDESSEKPGEGKLP